MLRNGQLPAAKLGGQYRVRTDDFLKWWDNQVKQEQKNLLKNRLAIYANAPLSESDKGAFFVVSYLGIQYLTTIYIIRNIPNYSRARNLCTAT